MKISLLLIAHNEEENLPKMIEGMINRYAEDIFEVVVVNDYSTDNTAKVVEALRVKYPRVRLINKEPPCGVGLALKRGFKEISPQAEYVLTMDSDFIKNIDEVQRLIDKAKEGYDGVIGSRFIKGSKMVYYPGPKLFSNRAFHFLARLLLGIKQRDLSNNFKLYKVEIVKNLPWKSDAFAMNAETGILPILAGYKIAEAPISWIGRSDGMGISKFKIFKEAVGYAKVLVEAIKFKCRGGPTCPPK